MISARVWIVWVLITASVVMLVRNPLYTLILFLSVQLVRQRWSHPARRLGIPLWRLGATILIFSAVFNALFTHIGANVLWRLPSSWPLIGGAITLESIVYGVSNGLLLLTLLLVFMAFNEIVSSAEIVRLIPSAFRDVGIVILIALTYVPETTRHLQRIREAQAIRGHQLRGIRDWQPLVVPLLVGGLERAINLAEAMVARGYGNTHSAAQSTTTRLLILLGLTLMLGGWITGLLLNSAGWIVFGVGILLIAGMVLRLGRGRKQTRYRANPLSRTDYFLLIITFVTFIVVWIERNAITYTPYPTLAAPPFSLPIALCLLLLAAPAFIARHD